MRTSGLVKVCLYRRRPEIREGGDQLVGSNGKQWEATGSNGHNFEGGDQWEALGSNGKQREAMGSNGC